MKTRVTRRIQTITMFSVADVPHGWQGKDLRCHECGCMFHLQPHDKPRIVGRLEEVDGDVVGVNEILRYVVLCPERCGTWIVVSAHPVMSKEDYDLVDFVRPR